MKAPAVDGSRVAVVFNGNTFSERKEELDTLKQAEEIAAYLSQLNFQVETVSFDQESARLKEIMQNQTPDFIFNLVEALENTDRLSYKAALHFEKLKIPYSGCSATSLKRLSTKSGQKSLLRKAGLPTPDFVLLDGREFFDGPREGRFIIKSDTEHASVGIDESSLADSYGEIEARILEKKKQYGGNWFAERYVEGREFNISLLEGPGSKVKVLPPAEMCFLDYPDHKPKIVDYEAKWEESSFAYGATVRKFDFDRDDEVLIKSLKELSRECWHLFTLKGLARVDFRIDEDKNPWILEVNANPCLSSDAGFMASARQAGLNPLDVINRLIPRY